MHSVITLQAFLKSVSTKTVIVMNHAQTHSTQYSAITIAVTFYAFSLHLLPMLYT